MNKKAKLLQAAAQPVEDLRADNKRLSDLVEQQAKRIDELQTKRAKTRVTKARPAVKKGSFVRIVIPDTHGCYLDAAAARAFLADLSSLGSDVGEVVWLGDHVECGGFLSGHALGYVSESTYSYQDDLDAANTLLDQVAERVPNAQQYYLDGNHERRVERWAMSQAQRHGHDAAYLLQCHGVASNLSLAKRGIEHFQQNKKPHGLQIPGTIKLGSCYFTHGESTAKQAASVTLSQFGGNVVFGHVHRQHQASAFLVNQGVIHAWCPGCLCERQRMWQHTRPSQWNHGWALQLVNPDGTFLHISVPIIDGRSYLTQLPARIQ